MTSLNHEPQPILKLREDAIAMEDRRKDMWKQVYEHLYAVGTTFANRKSPETSQPENEANPLNSVEGPRGAHPEFSGVVLFSTYGHKILERCVWGATYMSYLFEYLTQLEWDFTDTHPYGSTTQWVEILIGFRMTTHLATPVRTQSKQRVWQSPTICPWLPAYSSLGEESTAFSKIVRSLEMNTQKKLIPGQPQQKIPLSKMYCRNSQNSGVKGRAMFHNQTEIVRVFNTYMNAQALKARQIPKLKQPLGITGQFSGVVSPYDALLLDASRFSAWKNFQRVTSQCGDVLPDEALEQPSDDHPQDVEN